MDSNRINSHAARLGALLLPGLILMGCDAKHPERVPALSAAAVAAPRTLESTLRLHPDAQEIPFNPEIAGDDYGNAVAVWQQSDGKRVNIRTNRFVAGVGWGSASRIESGHSNSGEPVVAVDVQGDALVVWHSFDGERGQLWFNRYVAGGAWGRASLMDSRPGYAHSPMVTMDAAGHATLVWKQSDGLLATTWVKRYRVSEGWSTARHTCSPTAQRLELPDPNRGIARPAATPLEIEACY